MKYFDLYLAALYDALQAGGTQDAVERAVVEVNNPTDAGLVAHLKTVPSIPCGICGVPFPLEEGTPTLQEDVLCPTCKTATSPS
jgi:hypothetical protein